MGLIESGKNELTDDEVVRLIARPGFSTAKQVTDFSGRGVGIDAVHARVRALGGTVDIRSTKGRGTSITVRLPVTLAIVRALLARVGDETYALPMTHVNETAHLALDTIRQVKGRDVLVLRNEVLPLLHLRGRGTASEARRRGEPSRRIGSGRPARRDGRGPIDGAAGNRRQAVRRGEGRSFRVQRRDDPRRRGAGAHPRREQSSLVERE